MDADRERELHALLKARLGSDDEATTLRETLRERGFSVVHIPADAGMASRHEPSEPGAGDDLDPDPKYTLTRGALSLSFLACAVWAGWLIASEQARGWQFPLGLVVCMCGSWAFASFFMRKIGSLFYSLALIAASLAAIKFL